MSNWIQLASGRSFNLTGEESPIAITDIAASLSKINRFAGASLVPYSVAQHSVDVCRLVRKHEGTLAEQMLALLHDAHEIVINDIPSPTKWELKLAAGGLDHVETLSREIQVRILRGIGMPALLPFMDQSVVAFCDLKALAAEKRDLMAYCDRPWIDLPAPDKKRIKPKGWRAAEREFLAKYYELLPRVQEEYA